MKLSENIQHWFDVYNNDALEMGLGPDYVPALIRSAKAVEESEAADEALLAIVTPVINRDNWRRILKMCPVQSYARFVIVSHGVDNDWDKETA